MIKHTSRVLLFFAAFFAVSGFLNLSDMGFTHGQRSIFDPPFLDEDPRWVDSVMAQLSPRERLAQLFMVPVYPKLGQARVDEAFEMVREHKVGGLIFFQGGPVRQAQLTNELQQAARVPLLVAIDGEWGLAMRLDSVERYPWQMTLGAVRDEMLIYQMGARIARECRRIGVNVNFAPVLDVNNNPNNPVINVRSFGDAPLAVARKAFAYMLGMQDNQVLATGKHFPGHGDTDQDSHHTLPMIAHSRQRLDSIELVPFQQLIQAGLGAVMVAHLQIPALDSTPQRASSLSPLIINDLLKNELGFKGLVFTDALGMNGITNHNNPARAAADALLAGNDILLMPGDVPGTLDLIESYIQQGKITQDEIDARCRKVLLVKKWAGLDQWKPIETEGIEEELESPEADLLRRRIYEKAMTLLKNENQIVPFKGIDSVRIASVSIGTGAQTTFQQSMTQYDNISHFQLNKDAGYAQFKATEDQLARFGLVVVGIHSTSSRTPPSFGVTTETLNFVKRLSARTKVVLVVFGIPYILNSFELERIQAVVVAYEDNALANEYAAQLLYGGIVAQGVLPVSLSERFPAGSGIVGGQRVRLKYSVPLELKINDSALIIIDTLAWSAIRQGAFPGCQVLAAKNGIVFFQKSYGWHSYDSLRPVRDGDLYDLASVTKISATLPSVMRLHEQGLIDIRDTLSEFLPLLDSTNKQHISVIDVLTHQARLPAWIPFHLYTMSRAAVEIPGLSSLWYAREASQQHNKQVADRLFIAESYRDEVFRRIAQCGLESRRGYLYSDLGFYLMQALVEHQTRQPLDEYARQQFFEPLGATTLCFNPLRQFDRENIAPTSDDKLFRHQLLQGYVHDEGAAVLGGVAGHAGLFGNANDLAKLMQMYLNGGSYGGQQFFMPSTVAYFTSAPFAASGNRRGIGFDKPSTDGSPAFKGISKESFGHTGFTGITIWADPSTDIVFIFLSNRVHPDPENKLILELDTREKMHQAFYAALGLAPSPSY